MKRAYQILSHKKMINSKHSQYILGLPLKINSKHIKKITSLILITFTLLHFSCKENAANKVKDENVTQAKERDNKKVAGLPEMTFKSKEFDFGTINQGETRDALFEFTNTGESDLIITHAKASCGCTVPEWPKNKRIKPGEKGEIKALFDSKSRTNRQNKSITLTTNTLSGKEVIYVKGFVTPDPNNPRNKSNKNSQ